MRGVWQVSPLGYHKHSQALLCIGTKPTKH